MEAHSNSLFPSPSSATADSAAATTGSLGLTAEAGAPPPSSSSGPPAPPAVALTDSNDDAGTSVVLNSADGDAIDGALGSGHKADATAHAAAANDCDRSSAPDAQPSRTVKVKLNQSALSKGKKAAFAVDVITISSESTVFSTPFYVKIDGTLPKEARPSTSSIFSWRRGVEAASTSTSSSSRCFHPVLFYKACLTSPGGEVVACDGAEAAYSETERLIYFRSTRQNDDDGAVTARVFDVGGATTEESVWSPRPSREQLRALGCDGISDVECRLGFTISGIFQGEVSLWAWSATDRVVVVDIDGTITRTSAWGYLQTVYLGSYEYIHKGSVAFLRHMHQLGYKMLYLSARPLSHVAETRELLRAIQCEGGDGAPRGPLMTNRRGATSSLYMEVVSQTTGDFKHSVLRDICNVFHGACLGSYSECPLVWGVGNKVSDAEAYFCSGVPLSRILIVDPSGKILVGGGLLPDAKLLQLHSAFASTQQSASASAQSSSGDVSDAAQLNGSGSKSNSTSGGDATSRTFTSYLDPQLFEYVAPPTSVVLRSEPESSPTPGV